MMIDTTGWTDEERKALAVARPYKVIPLERHPLARLSEQYAADWPQPRLEESDEESEQRIG